MKNPERRNPHNRWRLDDHVRAYLEVAGTLPHRREGEEVLLELLPPQCERVLDVGTGDGRLLALILAVFPDAHGVGIDFSPEMLRRAHERFDTQPNVQIVQHNLEEPLGDIGVFDCVVSSFAIHHLPDGRKASLYAEVFDRLAPGGKFLNLEHVASPTEQLHTDFRVAMGAGDLPDDPSNILASVAVNLGWLNDAGFEHVDNMWKWRELALLVGERT